MDHAVVTAATRQWHRRLSPCVLAGGGHFEDVSVCNIGLQRNLRFLSTTVLQGSVATQVNDGRIFNDFFIANLLLSVTVKEF